MTQYRIHRSDSRNLIIQKKLGKDWVNVSYYGNSLKSLAGGLLDLIVSKCIPDDDNIAEALKNLELEYIRGIERIEESLMNSEIMNL